VLNPYAKKIFDLSFILYIELVFLPLFDDLVNLLVGWVNENGVINITKEDGGSLIIDALINFALFKSKVS
jgi:hypothetical protein